MKIARLRAIAAILCTVACRDGATMGFAQGPGLDAALPGGCTYYFAGDAQNAPNTQTLLAGSIDGETCGGLVFSGWVRTMGNLGGGAGNTVYILAPNDASAPWANYGTFTTTGDITVAWGIPIYSNPPNTDADFQFTTTCSVTKTGAARVCTTTTVVTGGATLHMTTTWADSTTPIWFVSFKPVGSTGGGEVRNDAIQAAMTNGVPTQLCWKALGNP